MPKVSTDAEMTREMIDILRETMVKSHSPGQTKRGAHAKSHGLLKAQFVIHDKHSEQSESWGFSRA
jgi:hypothetical protein